MKIFYQLKLKTINKKILKLYIKFLYTIFLKMNIKISKLMLPKIKKYLTLLKSPHVYKKAKEQFEFIKYTVIINIFENNIQNNFLHLLQLNKPTEIKLILRKIA